MIMMDHAEMVPVVVLTVMVDKVVLIVPHIGGVVDGVIFMLLDSFMHSDVLITVRCSHSHSSTTADTVPSPVCCYHHAANRIVVVVVAAVVHMTRSNMMYMVMML